MVPSALASSATPSSAPISVAKSPRCARPSGTSVTSTPIRSMDTRPASGQRLPATITFAAGCPGAQTPARIPPGEDGEAGRPMSGEDPAVTDGVAALDLAHLEDAAF